MLHSSGAHSHFVKIVARATNETVSASASLKAGQASAMGGGGGEAEAAAAVMMEMKTFNDLAARYLIFALLVALLAFVLFASPALADWLTSERFNSGWRLKGSKKATSEDWGVSEKPMMSVPRSRPIRQSSAMLATWSYVYNKLLLPTVPLLSLTRGQVLICLGYQALGIGFLFYGGNGASPSNYNRPGLLAVAQLPAVFLLATKNSLLILIGKSYEKVNFLHRVAGRLIVVCSLLHVGLVLKSYPLNLTRPTHLTGLVAAIGLGLVFIPSISFIRNTFYRIFLVSHVAGWITFIVAVNFHSRSARSYTVFALILYGLDLLLRAVKTRATDATIVPLAGGMTMLQAHGVEDGWRAGQHVWVRAFAEKGLLGEAHPFTIANAPASCSPLPGQHKLTLLAKSTGDWTRRLNKIAASHMAISEKGGFGVGKTVKLSVEGPYGGLMLSDFAESQSVLLIAGGSGITFAASVLEDIVGRAAQGSIHSRTITLIWTVKDVSCIEWYQDFLNKVICEAKDRTSLSIAVRLHVTGSSRFTSCPIIGGRLSPLRPNINSILSTTVEETLDHVAAKGLTRGGGIAVATCGPASLISAVRSSIAGLSKNRVVHVGGIACHSETFGW